MGAEMIPRNSNVKKVVYTERKFNMNLFRKTNKFSNKIAVIAYVEVA